MPWYGKGRNGNKIVLPLHVEHRPIGCMRKSFTEVEAQVIAISDARRVAEELHDRYEPIRAVTLVARTLQKALFAGRSDDVVFWALVHAHYRGTGLRGATEAELAVFRDFILPEPDHPRREPARKRRVIPERR